MNSQNSVDNEVIEEKTPATKKTSQKKTVSKKSAKEKESEPLFCQINENQIIDINAEFAWAENLESNQKRFVVFYCYQLVNEGKINLTDAARKAGYKDSKTLKITAQNLFKNPKIYKEVKNIQSQIAEKLTKTNLKNEIIGIIERKKERALFNPVDLYDIELAQTEDGITFVKGNAKPTNELTEKQKRMILGVKFEGQRGIVNYITPDKVKEENDLINIYRTLFDKQEDNSDGMEIETTAEIIKGSLQVKTKVIKSNSDIAELSDLRTENTAERAEED